VKIELPYFDEDIIKNYQSFIFTNTKLFKDKHIIIYDHLEGSIFNGGRAHNPILLKDVLPFFKKTGFTPGFTLTNHLSFDEIVELKGESFLNGNLEKLMNTIEFLLKEIKEINLIISNDELKKIINDNFKSNIIFNKSITSLSTTIDKKVFSNYDYIIPRVDLYKDLDLLDEYKAFYNNMIFLVSYECSGCPIYNTHYKLISQHNIQRFDYDVKECFYKKKENFKYISDIYSPNNDDYEYCTSEIYKNNIQKFISRNFKKIGGVKIGRNSKDITLIKKELNVIKNILSRKKDFL